MQLPAPGTGVRIRAPAKVNLLLRILGRRSDGFHEVETVFQAVDFCDLVTVTATGGGGYELRVVDDTGEPVDVGPVEENLVTRALEAFRARLGTECPSRSPLPGLDVRLVKRIPAGAGLGGGSSDAGAFLRGLNALLGDPLEAGALVELGAGLGADVAFFSGLAGRAVGRERGDVLSAAPSLPARTLLLGLPPVHVNTAAAYRRLARSREGAGGPPPAILDDLLAATAVAGADGWRLLAGAAVNDFDPVVAGPDPEIAGALEALTRAPCEYALLSGSGAAVFGVLSPGAEAERTLARLRGRTPETRWLAAGTLDRLPSPERVVPDTDFS